MQSVRCGIISGTKELLRGTAASHVEASGKVLCEDGGESKGKTKISSVWSRKQYFLSSLISFSSLKNVCSGRQSVLQLDQPEALLFHLGVSGTATVGITRLLSWGIPS